MIYQITDGSYSDYRLVAVLEGPDGLTDFELKEWHSLFTKLVEPLWPRPKSGDFTFGSKAWEDRVSDIQRWYQEREIRCFALGVTDADAEGWVDWLVKHHGFVRREAREISGSELI